MRVCHVVRQYTPSLGGLEAFVANLAASLRAHGCENAVLTLDRCFMQPDRRLARKDVVDDIEVVRVPMLGHRRFFLPLIEPKALRDFDIIHVHGIDGMFDRIARLPKRPGQAKIATSHGAFFHTPWMKPAKLAYFHSVTRLSAGAYDLLIGNCDADVQMLRRIGRNVVCIANGVAPLTTRCAQGHDLLFIGRLASHKRVERLIAMMAEPLLQDAILHIVGPDWDVARAALASQAEAMGVGGRVRLHGQKDPADLARIAEQCAVFVSASEYEGFGMSLIEGMSAGLVPVVAANASFAELIASAPVGRTADFANPAAAAAAVRAERDGIDRRRREKATAFAQRFAWEGHAARTAALYRRALGRPDPQEV